MTATHRYEVTLRWTGNTGSGTSDYRGYRRDHEVDGGGKPAIPGSSDPAFRGDASRWNPEELLVVALADPSMTEKAQALHEEIGALCFIARSVNFPVRHQPTVRAALVPSG